MGLLLTLQIVLTQMVDMILSLLMYVSVNGLHQVGNNLLSNREA